MRKLLQSIVFPALILCILFGLWWAWHLSHENAEPDEAEPVQTEVRTRVVLPEEKFNAAKIEVGTASRRSHQALVVVPGRITYNENHHVEIRAATNGVIVKMLHKPGDNVQPDQLLAVISSPEVGTARADQLRRANDLELAKRQQAWEESRLQGIEKIATAIRRHASPAEIRQSATDSRIGAVRETLLSAYSNLMLAESTATRMKEVATSGAVPGRVLLERNSQFESASAALQAAIEQSLFEANQSLQVAKTNLEDADRRHRIACQQVATLVGSNQATGQDATKSADSDDLSLVKILAPISGTIERRLLSESERVQGGDGLYVLADTSTVWVSADVRESQWGKMCLAAGDRVRVDLPAFDGERFEATVYYIGREVDPTTNSIPLVATLDNSKGNLRPGLFARVSLPIAPATETLMIPESAVATHERASFVFRPLENRTYDRVDVQLGQSQDGWVEVQSGLAEGEPIVVGGTFALKSELLLESEE